MERVVVPPVRLGGLVALLALAMTVSAHSWIESAFRIAANGTFVGPEGFPRGWVPRFAPGWNDKQAQHIIPDAGIYTGAELLNKYPIDANPSFPILHAAPGDKIAILHLENGHVTLPQNQPNKPVNRGTVFLYGTSQPKGQEKLFDVHLRWNKDGTGGDRRGKLLATRNYDDGQCYQDSRQPLARDRASRLAPNGAMVERELKCQSVVTLPEDLKPGEVYTVYWYWDWPSLNPDKLDVKATSDGRFPWAGSFMRGDAVPDGWSMDMIRINESYSSVIDIKITDKVPGVVGKGYDANFVEKQDVYHAGIKAQLGNMFDVNVDGAGGQTASPDAGSSPTSLGPSATAKPTSMTGKARQTEMASSSRTTPKHPGTDAPACDGAQPTSASAQRNTASRDVAFETKKAKNSCGLTVTLTVMETAPVTTVVHTVTTTVPATPVIHTVYVTPSPPNQAPETRTTDVPPRVGGAAPNDAAAPRYYVKGQNQGKQRRGARGLGQHAQ
ncbi:uncharacterized protein DCS_06634 [Drechmeria coniospora]|uniref:DUF7492 domain-containing protein n=1 Tax=Drechmeria coniospora TaxID=98403 RepID=A0A151GC92_DRECN|nr:uncharacterized protein DCS_06634 [Drechmeria coniospora]KYK54674.1 uncharacterized protein DCS_06634 [Drechmeria coniospora]